MLHNQGDYIIFGGFNVVWNGFERSGSLFFQSESNDFNKFNIDAYLADLHLGGRRFTGVNRGCKKMAKLDRFLVSIGVMDWYPNMIGVVFPRLWSDHSPIVF